VIFISIDDREQETLKMICNEAFGSSNCVGVGQWRRVEGKPGKSKDMGRTSEFILIYAKNKANFNIGLLPMSGSGLSEYRYEDENGKFRRGQIYYPNRGIHNYSVQTPYGNIISGDFTVRKEVFDDYFASNKIYFAEQGDHTPYLKVYLSDKEGITPTNTFGKEYGSSQSAVKEFKEIFDMDMMIFDNPKPTKLLKRLIMISGAQDDDIVLDFFSGSATTAHAVMQLNAEDGGNRKFIMVQLPEPCAPDSEAAKAGYKNICEIGKERIRRAGEKVVSDKWKVISKEEMRKYGCKELSRADCFAEGNGSGQLDIFAGQKITKGRNVFSVRPDETGGGVDSVKYSGGASEKLNKGVPAFSGDSQRIESGTGNPIAAMREGEIPCRYGYFGNDEPVTGNRENAGCPHKNTNHCPLAANHFIDIGFRVFKTSDSNMKDVYYGAGEYKQEELDLFVSNIKEDRTPLDLLYGCLLELALPLSLPHTEENIDGFTVHIVRPDTASADAAENAALVACFDEDISEKVLEGIAKKKPLRAVFRDSGFADDQSKINVLEIFKCRAPDTQVKVI
jgi:hypothetical protein